MSEEAKTAEPSLDEAAGPAPGSSTPESSTEGAESRESSRRGALSRRGVLVAGASGVAALTGVPSLVKGTPARLQGELTWQPRLLSPEEGQLLVRLCDLLLPRTSTPGALDCGVPEWIDLRVSVAEPEEQLEFLGGLSWLDRRAKSLGLSAFLELDEDQQVALLREISDEHDSHAPELEAGAAFFGELKSLALFAYFTSEKARVETLGLPARIRREELRGCTHEGSDHSG